jgi:DNA-binding transcriptional MerR regulator
MEWSVQQLARIAGTTSRTLRHYDSIGLLRPTRTGGNGYRYYGEAALLRLQRILLLRALGLGLPAVAEALANEHQAETALVGHLEWLRQERARLGRQIAAVQHTLEAVKEGREFMAEKMFDGFDHTRYQEEVEERWGRNGYARGDTWWRGLDPDRQDAWKRDAQHLAADWAAAAGSGAAPDRAEAQALARRHIEWLGGIPGTPAAPGHSKGELKEYLAGLGEMYVADPRFAANYGGTAGAAFVRDALLAYSRDWL